jgi:hypothetical protein
MSEEQQAAAEQAAQAADIEQQQSEGQQAQENTNVDQQSDTGETGDKKTPWYQRRIDDLTREKHDARRQNEAMEKILAQNQELLERLAPKPVAAAVEAAPDPKNYAAGVYDPGYQDARLEYVRKAAVSEALEMIQRQQSEATAAQTAAQKSARLESAETAIRAKYADYDAVIAPLISDPSVTKSQLLRDAFIDHERGPEIAYHLARNPDVAHSIATASYFEGSLQLAKVIDTLGARSVSGAPAPVRPINGAGAPAVAAKNLADMSTAEYIAARNKEEFDRKHARLQK